MLHNRERLLKIMDEYGFDVVIASSPENVLYFSEFWSLDQWLIKSQAFVIYPRDENKKPVLITPASNFDLMADNLNVLSNYESYGICCIEGLDTSNLSEVEERYKNFNILKKSFNSSKDALIATLKSLGLSTGKIGLDERGVSFTFVKELEEELGVQIGPAFELIQKTRIVKTDLEIKYIQEAVRVTELGIKATVDAIKIGMTEIELYKVFAKYLIENNVDPKIKCILVNEHSSFANAQPTNRKVKKNGLIRFDVGGAYQNYWSDTARMAIVGDLNQKQITYYDAIVRGQRKAIESIKPGIVSAQIFEIAVDEVQKNGIPHYKRHHVGHGIGLEVYDPPLIGPNSQLKIEEGMVLNVETPYYELGFGGLQIEDTILVTENGCEYLTKLPSDFFII